MRSHYIPKAQRYFERPSRIDFGSQEGGRRSIESFLRKLTTESFQSDYLYYVPVGNFLHDEDRYRLARYVFLAPAAHDEPIRLGIFAAIHGDEPEGVRALVEFLLRLHRQPERARGYQIFAYPVCNPTGFEDGTHYSRSGYDLNQEFWRGSEQPEAYFLERELGVLRFHGVITLHVGEKNGMHVQASGTTLSAALVEPALEAASRFIPRATDAPDLDSAKSNEGRLGNPTELKPAPFELIIETPGSASPNLQIEATVAALDRIIREYRPFLASQQNI